MKSDGRRRFELPVAHLLDSLLNEIALYAEADPNWLKIRQRYDDGTKT